MIVIKLYEGIDVNSLPILGSGTQGTVYKIDSKKCIKVFKKSASCKNEVKSLIMAQGNHYFPLLYSYGKNFIIREYINGTDIDKYLLSNPLTPYLSTEIIKLYEAMKDVGYLRLDAALFHIFITNDTDIKLIDTAKAMKKKVVRPNLILKGLEEHGYKNQFLNLVKITNPSLYDSWIKY